MSSNSVGTQPTLVFIHGFLDGASIWDDVVKLLGTRAEGSLRVDLPGMGARSNEAGPYGLELFAEDVAKQVRAVPGPVVLIGQSMGAQVAELAAVSLGDKVRGLVLVTPVPLAGMGLPPETMKTFAALGGDPAAQRNLRRSLSFDLGEERLEKLGQMGDRVAVPSVGIFANLWNQGHSSGAVPSKFEGPVLVVRGANDSFVTAEIVSACIETRFRGQGVAVVDQAGHWPHVEQPEAFTSLLEPFLATVYALPADSAPKQGWTNAFHKKSANAFADTFAADVVLEASVLAKPAVGLDLVRDILTTASQIYEALTFTHETVNGQRSYLEWQAKAFGGQMLPGVTILVKNEEGKVVRAAIHHRGLGSVLSLSSELRRRLKGKVDESYFYAV